MPPVQKSRKKKRIPYAFAAFFVYILMATQFFQRFGEAQFWAQQHHFGSMIALPDSQHRMGLGASLQHYFVELVTAMDLNRMHSFIEDGFGFSGIARAGERLEPQAPDGFRFVRRQNLIHDPQIFAQATHAPQQMIGDDPVVFLFNSHSEERFSDNETTVMDLGMEMEAVFVANGIPTLRESRLTHIWMNENWGPFMFARSYEASRVFIEERINQFDSLKFFFDIHRDAAVSDPWTTIDGTDYARIMLVIGTDNPWYQDNLDVAREIAERLEAKRPGIMRSRPISVQGGRPGIEGQYNQDISAFTHLFEIGDNLTPPHAARNSARLLAEVLSEFIHSQDLAQQ